MKRYYVSSQTGVVVGSIGELIKEVISTLIHFHFLEWKWELEKD